MIKGIILSNTEVAIQKDGNILYNMPVSLFYMYRKIMSFLTKIHQSGFALVITEKNRNWIFYISDKNGKSIHRITAYEARLSHSVSGQGFDFFQTSGLSEKERSDVTQSILMNIKKSIDFNYCRLPEEPESV